MPVDYRFDPFSNTKQPITISNEKWTIPSSSPFTIRLMEVPLKEIPSSVSIRVVDSLAAAITTNTQTTITVVHGSWFSVGKVIAIDSEKLQVTAVSGNTLTVSRGYNGTTASTHTVGMDVYIEDSMAEVAAAPSVGQYWPDYSTSADNDPGWNTGTILFNSADAGKQIAATYKGMGTLADARATNHGKKMWTTPGTYTWTVPINLPVDETGKATLYLSEAGGGGGGGGAYSIDISTPAWGGAGGGAHSIKCQAVSVKPGQTMNIVVGAGGSAGPSTSGDLGGGTGGTSSFGSISCPGGVGGAKGHNGPAQGGAAGGVGGTAGSYGCATSVSIGGSSMFGVGGVTSNRGSTFNVTGVTGCGYGAGGGGGMVNAAGGAGTNGFVLVEW